MLRGVPQGSDLGPYCSPLYVHPLLNLLNSFSDGHSRHVCGRPLYYRKGSLREDAIPTAKHGSQKLHAWSQENGLAINPSKCEAAWFTLSTHTESDYDREGKWPLVVAGCENPSHDHGGTTRELRSFLALISIHEMTLNVAASAQAVRSTSQRIIAATLHSAEEAGPSHLTYVRSSLDMVLPNYAMAASSYGQLATDSAKNEMQKTYATPGTHCQWSPSTVGPGIRTSRG
ncbi:hypothetical protein TcYC6_0033630 [Trypanosoma cruzi]|nr:hypothetical protein TcYC6_0033630 [Trypanosoma cruzi]